MKEPTIVFYTLPFFQELARQLNADAEWSRSAKDLSLRIVCTAADRHLSFLLEINRGTVVAAEAKPDLPADFKFEARYEDWMRLCKGEAEFEKLVTTGKIRVGGSMPRLMSLMGPLNHVVVVARRFPKKF